MGIVKIVLLILAGLGGVIATEAGVVTWLTYAPLSLDLTGNYFTLAILPVVALVVILAALALWKILAANPLRNCLIFAGVYIAAESFGLTQMGNPLTVVASYGLIMAGVCGIVFASFARLFWLRPN